jgi:hypothetical protein
MGVVTSSKNFDDQKNDRSANRSCSENWRGSTLPFPRRLLKGHWFRDYLSYGGLLCCMLKMRRWQMAHTAITRNFTRS